MYIRASGGFSTGSLFRKLLIKPAVNPSTHFLGDITSLCQCKMYSILIRWDGWDTSIEDWGAKTPENDIQGSLHEKRQKSCVKLYLIHSGGSGSLKPKKLNLMYLFFQISKKLENLKPQLYQCCCWMIKKNHIFSTKTIFPQTINP